MWVELLHGICTYPIVQRSAVAGCYYGRVGVCIKVRHMFLFNAALPTVFTLRSFTEDLITSPLSPVPAPNTTPSCIPLRMRPHPPLHLSSITRENPILLYLILRYGLADRIREVNGQVGSGYTGAYYVSI